MLLTNKLERAWDKAKEEQRKKGVARLDLGSKNLNEVRKEALKAPGKIS